MAFKDIGKPRKAKDTTVYVTGPVGRPYLLEKGDKLLKQWEYSRKFRWLQLPAIIILDQETVDLEYNTDLLSLHEMSGWLLTKYGADYTNLRIEVERETGYYDDVTTTYTVWGTRPESELERDFRMKKEQADKQRKLDAERKEFERLQKKFGDKYDIKKKEGHNATSSQEPSSQRTSQDRFDEASQDASTQEEVMKKSSYVVVYDKHTTRSYYIRRESLPGVLAEGREKSLMFIADIVTERAEDSSLLYMDYPGAKPEAFLRMVKNRWGENNGYLVSPDYITRLLAKVEANLSYGNIVLD